MLWLFVGHTGVYMLDFFCSGIQFYLLLIPYLCFISLLYLDLYVLGEDALISWGSFMQTKILCVLIHIWIKGKVGAVKPVLAPHPIPWLRRRCIHKKIHYLILTLTLVSMSHKMLPSTLDLMWPMHQQSLILLHPTEKMHLQENTLFDQGHTRCCPVPSTSCDLCT